MSDEELGKSFKDLKKLGFEGSASKKNPPPPKKTASTKNSKRKKQSKPKQKQVQNPKQRAAAKTLERHQNMPHRKPLEPTGSIFGEEPETKNRPTLASKPENESQDKLAEVLKNLEDTRFTSKPVEKPNFEEEKRRLKYTALGLVPSTKENGRVIRLNLGIDFGSTSSKAVVRLPYESFETVAVPAIPGLEADKNPYYASSHIFQNSNGEFSFFSKDCKDTFYHSLKLDFLLRCEESDSSDLSACDIPLIAFLPLFVKQALGWFSDNYKGRSKENIKTFISFGFPAKNFTQTLGQQKFYNVCAVVLKMLYKDHSVGKMQIEDVMTDPSTFEVSKSFKIVPELIGAVSGFANSNQRELSDYFILDAGGLTLDYAMFSLRVGEKENLNIGLASCGSERLGAEVYRKWKSLGNSDKDFVSILMNKFCPLVKLAFERRGNQDEFWLEDQSRIFASGRRQTIARQKIPKTLPTFIVGGGGNFEIFWGGFERSNISIQNTDHARKFVKKDLSGFAKLEHPLVGKDQFPERLVVAYGLSYPEYDLPEWYDDQNRQITKKVKTETFEMNFVGPEQV